MGREREERVIHQSYLWSYTRSKQTTLKYCFDKQKFRKETQKWGKYRWDDNEEEEEEELRPPFSSLGVKMVENSRSSSAND